MAPSDTGCEGNDMLARGFVVGLKSPGDDIGVLLAVREGVVTGACWEGRILCSGGRCRRGLGCSGGSMSGMDVVDMLCSRVSHPTCWQL